jgi:hypothetical protein
MENHKMAVTKTMSALKALVSHPLSKSSKLFGFPKNLFHRPGYRSTTSAGELLRVRKLGQREAWHLVNEIAPAVAAQTWATAAAAPSQVLFDDLRQTLMQEKAGYERQILESNQRSQVPGA